MVVSVSDIRLARVRKAEGVPHPVRRQNATKKTLERYKGKAFDWAKGITCVHMARAHLRNMGHRPPGLPRFRSALGAKKAMQERGWQSVTEMLDSLLPRIAPAQMVLGDIAVVPGDAGMESIMISVGPRKVMGWLPDGSAVVVYDAPASEFTAAWRV